MLRIEERPLLVSRKRKVGGGASRARVRASRAASEPDASQGAGPGWQSSSKIHSNWLGMDCASTSNLRARGDYPGEWNAKCC